MADNGGHKEEDTTKTKDEAWAEKNSNTTKTPTTLLPPRRPSGIPPVESTQTPVTPVQPRRMTDITEGAEKPHGVSAVRTRVGNSDVMDITPRRSYRPPKVSDYEANAEDFDYSGSMSISDLKRESRLGGRDSPVLRGSPSSRHVTPRESLLSLQNRTPSFALHVGGAGEGKNTTSNLAKVFPYDGLDDLNSYNGNKKPSLVGGVNPENKPIINLRSQRRKHLSAEDAIKISRLSIEQHRQAAYSDVRARIQNEMKKKTESIISKILSAIEKPTLPILLPDSKFKSFWEKVLLLAVIHTALAIPFYLGFDVEPTTAARAFIILVDFVFIFDVIINCRSAVMKDNKYIKTGPKIFKHYVTSGWFVIDFISALPLGLIMEGVDSSGNGLRNNETLIDIFSFMRLLKTLKLAKVLSGLGQGTRSSIRPSDAVRVLHLIFYELILSHWVACIYFYMNRRNNFPPHIFMEGVDTSDLVESYTYCFEWALSNLTGISGEMKPISTDENIFTTVVVLMGIFAYAVILGNVYSILQNANFAAADFQRRVDSVRQYMQYRNVPEKHMGKVMMYYRILWSRNRGVNEDILLSDLSRNLRNETLRYVNIQTIQKLDFLKEAKPEHKKLFCEAITSTFQLPGETFISEGEQLDFILFITRGKIDVLQTDEVTGRDTKIAIISPGDNIGLYTMVLELNHLYSFRAKTFCDMVAIPCELFLNLSPIIPELRTLILNELKKSGLAEAEAKKLTKAIVFGEDYVDDEEEEQSRRHSMTGAERGWAKARGVRLIGKRMGAKQMSVQIPPRMVPGTAIESPDGTAAAAAAPPPAASTGGDDESQPKDK